MGIEFYTSPLIMSALGVCIGASIYLLKHRKTVSSLLILLGFVMVTVIQFSINYCIGLAVLNIGISNNPIFCNSITPHIKGVGYTLIALGVFKLVQELKKHA